MNFQRKDEYPSLIISGILDAERREYPSLIISELIDAKGRGHLNG